MKRLSMYLDFIEKRAPGELITPATWIRNFVRNHPAYKGDSVVSDEIAYDLMIACKDIGEGNMHVPELLGNLKITEFYNSYEGIGIERHFLRNQVIVLSVVILVALPKVLQQLTGMPPEQAAVTNPKSCKRNKKHKLSINMPV